MQAHGNAAVASMGVILVSTDGESGYTGTVNITLLQPSLVIPQTEGSMWKRLRDCGVPSLAFQEQRGHG